MRIVQRGIPGERTRSDEAWDGMPFPPTDSSPIDRGRGSTGTRSAKRSAMSKTARPARSDRKARGSSSAGRAAKVRELKLERRDRRGGDGRGVPRVGSRRCAATVAVKLCEWAEGANEVSRARMLREERRGPLARGLAQPKRRRGRSMSGGHGAGEVFITTDVVDGETLEIVSTGRVGHARGSVMAWVSR